MPRFVILEHDHPTLHWDLMLEAGSVLKTWRLARAPEQTGEKIEAVSVGDHRVFYLGYEGPVGGGRGAVQRWDTGNYECRSDLDSNVIEVRLAGQRLRGDAVLFKDGPAWWFAMDSTLNSQ